MGPEDLALLRKMLVTGDTRDRMAARFALAVLGPYMQQLDKELANASGPETYASILISTARVAASMAATAVGNLAKPEAFREAMAIMRKDLDKAMQEIERGGDGESEWKAKATRAREDINKKFVFDLQTNGPQAPDLGQMLKEMLALPQYSHLSSAATRANGELGRAKAALAASSTKSQMAGTRADIMIVDDPFSPVPSPSTQAAPGEASASTGVLADASWKTNDGGSLAGWVSELAGDKRYADTPK